MKKISAMGLVIVLLFGELSGAVSLKTVYASETEKYELTGDPEEGYINTPDERLLDEGYLDEPGGSYINELDDAYEDNSEISYPDATPEAEAISLDGAGTSISGTVNVSTLAENSELVLTGDTTLVVDTDKKLKNISGNYDLTINGDKTLTLMRVGKVIDVKNLTVNAPLDITGGNDAAIYASETVYINNDVRIDAVTGIQAKYAIVLNKGKIILTTGLRSVWSTDGSVTVRTVLIASSKDQDVINAAHSVFFENAFVDLISDGDAKSAIYANHDIEVTGGRVGAEGTTAFNSKYGNIDLNGIIVAKSGSRPAIHAQEGSVTLAGEVTADSKITAIWAQKDITVESGSVTTSGPRGILSDEGAITINGSVRADASKNNAITAKKDIIIKSGSDVYAHCGKNSAAIQSYSGNIAVEKDAAVKAYGAKEAITAEEGYIALEGNVEAGASGWAIWSEKGIFITGGKTTATSGAAIWTGGPVTINGDVKVQSTGNGTCGISGTAVAINKGTVIAECGTNGAAIRARTGDITVGKDANVTANGAKEGITAEEGGITLKGNVEAKASGWPIWAKGDIKIEDGSVKTEGNSVGASGITAGGTITVMPPLLIVEPVGGKISANGRAIVNADNKNVSWIEIKAIPITGSAQILGTETYAGDTLTLKTTDVPSPYQIRWQKSPDNAAWKNVTGSSGNTCPTKAGDAGYFFRAVVTATGYGGEVISSSRLVQAIPALTGSVVYTSGYFSVGKKITTGLTGGVLEVYNASHDSVHYKWQVSNDGNSGWTDISGAVTASYTSSPSDADKYIRVAVTADKHTGVIYSTKRKIVKNANEESPVKPQLTVSAPYSQITIVNAKADQEYTVAYPTGYGTVSPDWTSASHPSLDGSFKITADKDRTVIVFTRMRETGSALAGTKTESDRIYNGYITTLADLTLDRSVVTTKVGEVTKLTVSPLPEDFSGWNDEYTVTWGVNGTGIKLWTNADCYIPAPNGPTYHKTVYAMATAPSSYAKVIVEKQVSYSDIRMASCTFEVTDASGNHLLEYLDFDEVTMQPGETVTQAYTTVPSPALVGTLSFVKNSGPSTDLTLTAGSAGEVTITAPADAEAGDYYYGVKVDGSDTSTMSFIKITVLSTKATVTLSPNNGNPAEDIKNTVEIGSQFILPEMPASFSIPDGYEFDGWDMGDVGDGIIVGGNITVKAKWKTHVHTLENVPATEPTCTWDGNLEYWYCTTCHKEFADKDGLSEMPMGSFILPATGHTSGTPQREFEIPCDEDNDGSYDEVVYCTVCMEELSRTHVTVERRILEKFTLAADTDQGGFGPFLKNTAVTLGWKDGLPVDPARYDVSDAVQPAIDEDCNELYAAWSEADTCYVKYTVLNKTDGDSSLIFSKLEKDNCLLNVSGYNSTCLKVTPSVSGGKSCVDIVFKLDKKKEYDLKAQPEEFISSVTLNEDGTYLTAADQGIILHNTGLKDVTFDYKFDPTDDTSSVILSGEDKDVFTVSPIGAFPATIPAGGSLAVCSVNAKNGLQLTPNRVYRAELTLKTDHAGDGAMVTLPMSFGAQAPAVTGIWMKDITAQVYTGKKIKPEVEVYWGEKLLTAKDYSVSYKNNKNAYTLTDGEEGFDPKKAPTVTVKGKGSFKGSFSRYFVIDQVDLSTQGSAPDVQNQYTGKELKPTTDVTVILDGRTAKLKAGKDFIYEYPSGAIKEVGTYSITIRPKSGNFKGYLTFSAEISDKKPILKLKLSKIKAVKWDGSLKTPDITIKDGNHTLVKGVDYTVAYENNKDAGTATAAITGTGSYFGTKTVSFEITGTPIAKARMLTYDGYKTAFSYDGTAKTNPPGTYALTLDNGATTIPALNYDVAYEDNILPGTAKMIFTGKPDKGYTGTLTRTFKIDTYDMDKDPLGKLTVYYEDGGVEKAWNKDTAPAFGYSKAGAKPVPIVKFGGLTLNENVDYTLSWSNNTALKGELTGKKDPVLTIKGKGDFKGSTARVFKIAQREFSSAVTVIAQDVNRQDKPGIYKTQLTVLENGTGSVLKAGTDYCGPDDPSHPVKYVYESVPALEKVMNYNGKNQPMTEVSVTPGVTEVMPTHVIPSGTVIRVTVTGKGAYDETNAQAVYRFVNKETSIADRRFKVTAEKQQWSGGPVTLKPEDITILFKVNKNETVKLKAGIDYEIVPGSYINNIKIGKAKVTVRGLGEYGGTRQVDFGIVKKRMNYAVCYDSGLENLRTVIYDRYLSDTQKATWTDEQKAEWYGKYFRITGTMKASDIPYRGRLRANAYKVQRYNETSKKWEDIPQTELGFKGWALKSGGSVRFKDKDLCRPLWLLKLTYDDSITLYAVWG